MRHVTRIGLTRVSFYIAAIAAIVCVTLSPNQGTIMTAIVLTGGAFYFHFYRGRL